MENKGDKTKSILKGLLNELYKEQALNKVVKGDSYLQAQDGQFLGRITTNIYDNDSILNKYGPYGSEYSGTSIFNPYSEYGSRYGNFSINNPYSFQPPKLTIRGQFIAYITTNKHIKPSIDSEVFICKLKDDIDGLLRIEPGSTIPEEFSRKDSYIMAQDGTFLGKLSSNEYDSDSILNQYGNFGSQYSPTSIFNKYGSYGNPYSSFSPYNEITSTPPKIFIDGQFWGFLTKNKYVSGNKIDPDNLKNWIYEKGL